MLQNRLSAFALTCAAMAVVSSAASSQPQSFAGKTVTLTIGYGPGSGNDIYGRLIAKHIGKHIPGRPNVVPQNMPGAGSFKAANWLFAAAPKDGSVLGYISQTAPTEELLGKSGIQFKTA